MAIETIGAVAAAAAVQASRARAMAKADKAWGAYAASHGMHYEAPRGWLRREWPRVEGSLGGGVVGIEVATHLTHIDYSTAFVAVMSGPVQGNLEVTREGFGSRIAQLMGAEDIEVGDGAFDRAFVVKASPKSHAKDLLDAEVRAELSALRADRLTYGNGDHGDVGLVVMELVGIVEDTETLDRGLRLVAKLARRA